MLDQQIHLYSKKKLTSLLPFSLTKDQLTALNDIYKDLNSSSPMFRLLQGDVGSGKTIVAFYSLIHVVEANYQGALMAPTEVLAKQHFKLFYEPEFGLLSQFVQTYITGEMYVLLSTPAGALIGVIVADAWQWTPFVMLLVLAGLVSVPKHLYEAAEIDRTVSYTHLTLPTTPYV